MKISEQGMKVYTNVISEGEYIYIFLQLNSLIYILTSSDFLSLTAFYTKFQP